MFLSKYHIQYVIQKAIKGSALADYLAHQRIEDYQSIQPKFPDKEILALFNRMEDDNNDNTWTSFFDGASNALGYGIGVVLISPKKQYVPMTARLYITFHHFLREDNQLVDALATLSSMFKVNQG